MKLARWLLPTLSLVLVLWFTWDLSRSSAGPGAIHPAHAAVAALDGGANCAGCHGDGGVDALACMACHAPIAEQLEQRVGLHGGLAAAEVERCEACHSDHHQGVVPLIAPHAFLRAGVEDVEHYDHRHVVFGLRGAHAALACDRCHAGADAVEPPVGGRFVGLSQVCTSCHRDVHEGAFGSTCQECHGQQQPWPEVPDFRHQRFLLEGAHARVTCGACHEHGSGRDVKSERQAELPVRACNDCHQNPHGTQQAAATALALADAGDCARCHTSAAWQRTIEPLTLHEQLGFPLRGRHASAACADCHGDASQVGSWRGEAPALASCGVCHDSSHSPELLATAAAVGPVESNPINGCAGCHVDTDVSFADGRISADQHRSIGFALTAPHAEVACIECHRGADHVERYPGRQAAHCRTCHVDVHAGQFLDPQVLGQEVSRQCTDCHRESHFIPHAFGAAMHATTGFPLRGAHDAVACHRCHDQVIDGVRRFDGTPRQCAQCHADVHGGRFDRAGLPTQLEGRRGCARCHDSNAFAPVVTDFAHATWTGYELAGAHAQVGCVECHGKAADGRLAVAPGSSCAACHVDPHLGQFTLADGTLADCRRCHESTSWSELRFDHGRDSRFQLDDVHARLACSKCHVSYAFAGRQVARYKPLGVLCGDCHQLGGDHGRAGGSGVGVTEGGRR